ncbi:MAG: heat-inducible transcription repressor HrcA [Acidobacteria bacterium]|nr:MAG: heat-inducible transcription repressor HrcA [Acidobacteriota bacterium]
MLDERKQAILSAIVEEYISTGIPVGSQTVVMTRNLGVSAATVRNDMKQLEREGYIEQPHTSAGRVPTDLGYRQYVDNVEHLIHLRPALKRMVERFFSHARAEMRTLLAETSRLVAEVTDHAAVVVGPVASQRLIRGAHLDRLGDTLILATLVSDTGQVESRRIDLGDAVSVADVEEAAGRFKAAMVGQTALEGLNELAALSLAGAPKDPPAEGALVIIAALARAFDADDFEAQAPYYLGGAHRTAAEGSFRDPADIHRVLELLEQQATLVGLLRSAVDAEPVAVLIGGEIPLDALRHCTLVATGFGAGGQNLGTIGVVGPTRMDYSTVISGVAEISSRLGYLLEYGSASKRSRRPLA